MKKILFITLFITASFGFSDIDSKESSNKRSFRERLYYTGNIGLDFGESLNFIATPAIGYKLTKKLGYAVGYSYGVNSSSNSFYKFSNKVHGPKTFLSYKVLSNLYAQTKYEFLTHKVTRQNLTSGVKDSTKTNSHHLKVGLGYVLGAIGLKYRIGVFYDLLHNDESFYDNAFSISTGVVIGF